MLGLLLYRLQFSTVCPPKSRTPAGDTETRTVVIQTHRNEEFIPAGPTKTTGQGRLCYLFMFTCFWSNGKKKPTRKICESNLNHWLRRANDGIVLQYFSEQNTIAEHCSLSRSFAASSWDHGDSVLVWYFSA